MTRDSVSFTADGPNALSHIRRVLAGYDLDEDADGVNHIEVKIQLDGSEPEREEAAEPAPSSHMKDDTPGRIRVNTRHHQALYALAVMDHEGETPATAADVSAHVNEHTSFDEMSPKFASSALGRCSDRGLCDRERPGQSFSYELNDAGKLEIQRLGVPGVFKEEKPPYGQE